MNTQIFDSFPEPILLIGSDLIVKYGNSAVFSLLPGCRAGSSCPKELTVLPDADGAFSCQLSNRQFQAACHKTDDGTLLILRAAQAVPKQAFSPILLAAQVRENVQQLSFAAHLLAKTPDLSEQEKRHLATIQQSLYRQLRLASHLEQAQALAEGSEPAFHPAAIDLAELCRDMAYGVGALASQLGVCFQSSVPGGMLITTGDRSLLEQMLLELISNALRAAGPGGRAGLKLAVTGSAALITVWDNGPGMKGSELAGLMGAQTLQRPPQPGAGLGLGLALARCAAQLPDGSIVLESPQSQGMHATVSLPIRRPSKGALATPRKQPDNGYSSLLLGLADALPWQCFQEEM